MALATHQAGGPAPRIYAPDAGEIRSVVGSLCLDVEQRSATEECPVGPWQRGAGVTASQPVVAIAAEYSLAARCP